MKLLRLLPLLLIVLLSKPSTAYAGDDEKTEARITYVIHQLHLNNGKAKLVRPCLKRYYSELAEIKSSHKALKAKYEKQEKNGTLTPAQCDELFNSKQQCEMQELALKKKYYSELLSKYLTRQECYKAVKLLNDKVK